jgi:nitrate reductase NapAB chaperone NapD
MLLKQEQFPPIEDVTLFRALRVSSKLILVVNKKSRDALLSLPDLVEEMKAAYGAVVILERPTTLRKLVRDLVHPAIEAGVNSLYLPDGSRENIVVLRAEDKPRIAYSLEELRQIVSAVMEEQAIFQYQEEGIPQKPKAASDDFDRRMKDFSQRRARR